MESIARQLTALVVSGAAESSGFIRRQPAAFAAQDVVSSKHWTGVAGTIGSLSLRRPYAYNVDMSLRLEPIFLSNRLALQAQKGLLRLPLA